MNIYVKAFMDKNFGDDLMLIKLLKSFPKATFYINCKDVLYTFYNELFKEFNNYILTPIELKKINQFGKGFFKYIILIGGSVLQGSRNKGCYYRMLNILAIKFASLYGTKYFIIGCNTGPFINSFTKFLVKMEIKAAQLITTRDSISYQFITQSNKKAQKYIFCDMLMNLGLEYNISRCVKNNTLGISVLNSNNPNLANEKLNTFFAKAIDQYIERTGGKVFLFAFNIGNQNDLFVANKIYELVKNKSEVQIISHSVNYLQIPAAIAMCNKILAVRFHSAILAMSIGIPTIPLIYSNKMSNLLYDLNYKGKYMKLENIQNMKLSKFVDMIISEDKFLCATSKEVNQANKHMEILKNYIK